MISFDKKALAIEDAISIVNDETDFCLCNTYKFCGQTVKRAASFDIGCWMKNVYRTVVR